MRVAGCESWANLGTQQRKGRDKIQWHPSTSRDSVGSQERHNPAFLRLSCLETKFPRLHPTEFAAFPPGPRVCPVSQGGAVGLQVRRGCWKALLHTSLACYHYLAVLRTVATYKASSLGYFNFACLGPFPPSLLPSFSLEAGPPTLPRFHPHSPFPFLHLDT